MKLPLILPSLALLCTHQLIPDAAPRAAFSVSCDRGSCAFQDQSTGGIRSWRWGFGDGTISVQQYPTHVYANGAIYGVALMVTDGQGRSSTILKQAIPWKFQVVVVPADATVPPDSSQQFCGIIAYENGQSNIPAAEDAVCGQALADYRAGR